MSRSRRACKTAALKALMSSQMEAVVTHSFPAWEVPPSLRKKLHGRRREATESPLHRVRRLNTAKAAAAVGASARRATRGLLGFRKAHRAGSDSDE